MYFDPSCEEYDVSVIIPHYNQHRLLDLCLESVVGQTYPADRVQIIVVDNDRPGGLGDLPAKYPGVVFLNETKRGAAHARNTALAEATGKAIAFIDADCVAHPEWLEFGLKSLETAPLSGGQVEVSVENTSAPTPTELFETVFAFRQETYTKRKKFSVTANLMARRDAVAAIGWFRHGVPEDLDWCQRGVALGFHLAFNAKAIVYHPARRDWSELSGKWRRLINERRGVQEGRGPYATLKWLGLAMLTAFSFAPHSLTVLSSEKLCGFRQRIGVLGVLLRIRLWRAWRMVSIA